MKDIVTGELRKKFYVVYATIGFTLGVGVVGISAAGIEQPTAVIVALAVYGFIGTAFGFTASANITPEPEPDVGPDPRLIR